MAFDGVINLAEGQFHKEMVKNLYHDSFIEGNYNPEFTFSGAKGITVLSPVTQKLHKYALNDDLSSVADGGVKVTRYGPITEAEDAKQDMTMGESYSFNMSLEQQNRSDQRMIKDASLYLKEEINEQVTPMMDRAALHKWANWTKKDGEPGDGIKTKTGAALTKSTAVEEILEAETWFMNAGVPDRDRICYVPASVYAKLRLADEFVQGPEPSFLKKAVEKGVLGMIGSMKIVRIPDTYLKNDDEMGTWDDSDIQFIATWKKAVIRPVKLDSGRILSGSANPFLNGCLIQGHYYFDAFVLAARAAGVYVYRAG